MLLSASINLFDGHELVAPPLRNLRPQIDHVSVVYQIVSYWIHPASEALVPLLDRLKSQGWINYIVQYHADEYPHATPKMHEARTETKGREM